MKYYCLIYSSYILYTCGKNKKEIEARFHLTNPLKIEHISKHTLTTALTKGLR